MTAYNFDLFADCFQFYVRDERAEVVNGSAWDREAADRMLAVGHGMIAVGTVRNVDVPVTIEILESEPTLDLGAWDNVSECSFATWSGRLVVAGCTEYAPDAARIDVAPGLYRARISGGGFETVMNHWEAGDDRYRVQLWPGRAIEPTVLKKYAPRSP